MREVYQVCGGEECLKCVEGSVSSVWRNGALEFVRSWTDEEFHGQFRLGRDLFYPLLIRLNVDLGKKLETSQVQFWQRSFTRNDVDDNLAHSCGSFVFRYDLVPC